MSHGAEVARLLLAWGTVSASFCIESFSLERMIGLDRGQLDDRMAQFRNAARVG